MSPAEPPHPPTTRDAPSALHALLQPLRLPVIAAPMFIVSTVPLVSAQCRAGIIGSMPALNARTTEQLDSWLTELRAELDTERAARRDADDPRPVAPYAVNLIVHRSNTRLADDLSVIVKHRVPIVITSLGAREDVSDAVHRYGGIVLHDVIHNDFAKKAVERGADGLIAVAAGAGGHAGTQSPFALINEIRTWFDGPLALSGAIAHGRSVFGALAAGADFAYLGSVFLAAAEANAAPEYQQMVVNSRASDIVYTNAFTGVHGNYLRGSIEAAGLNPDALPESDPSQMDFAAMSSEVKAWRDIWGAGQGVGTVDRVAPVADIVTRLESEFLAAAERLRSRER